MTTATHTDFPSDETLAAFIDGRLDPETRKRVLEHMVTCESCYPTFLMASEMRAEEGAGAPSVAGSSHTSASDGKPPGGTLLRGSFGRKALMGIPAALVAAAVLVVFFREPIRERYEDYKFSHMDGMTALVAASSDSATRPIGGRVMGGFPYKPLQSNYRGGQENESGRDEINWKLSSAAARVDEEAKASIQTLHNAGVAHLVLKEWDASVISLETALRLATGTADVVSGIRRCTDAALLNDLSAAYSARSVFRRNALDAIMALQAVDRAMQISRTPEAVWNRAVALKTLNRKDEAKAAWELYLKIDPSSDWAQEARDNLTRLSEEP